MPSPEDSPTPHRAENKETQNPHLEASAGGSDRLNRVKISSVITKSVWCDPLLGHPGRRQGGGGRQADMAAAPDRQAERPVTEAKTLQPGDCPSCQGLAVPKSSQVKQCKTAQR